MKNQVIGVAGPAGVGKDTAADYLVGQGHQSELGLDAVPGDITIANDGDLKKLYGALYDAVIA